MHDMSAHAAQHHAPPTSFIRKHVFSLDHKVIGKQYYALALVAAVMWNGSFLVDASSTWRGTMPPSPGCNCFRKTARQAA